MHLKDSFKNLALLVVTLLVTLLLIEGLSRVAMPVQYGNTFLTQQGDPYNPREGSGLKPGTVFRMVTQEFDVGITHTKDGYRGLAMPVNPETVFIGDSMTYGNGLNDKETIPHIYCREMDVTCANLGIPGTATAHQVVRLEKYLRERNWRPREVRLLFNGMISAMLAGNDFLGNLEAEQQAAAPENEEEARPAQNKGSVQWVIAQRKTLLEHSNLVRNIYYIYGPILRAKLSPETAEGERDAALAATQKQLLKLQSLAEEYDFSYSIYITNPMQDLMNKGYEQTWTTLQDIAPTDRVYTTAPPLLEGQNPAQYYYPLDGHLNAQGARKVAMYIAKMDGLRGNKNDRM